MANVVIFCGYSLMGLGTKPAGAYTIANVFRSIGLSAIVVDMAFAFDREKMTLVLDRFVGQDTKFVCLSTTLLGAPGTQYNYIDDNDKNFAPIMEACRRRSPDVKFIIGGSKVTQSEYTALSFDYGVKGQGENALVAIVNHVLYGTELIVDNVVNGVQYVSDKVYGYGDFNTSNYLKFTDHDAVLQNETLVVEYGRGCVFKCSYCNYDLAGKNFGDYTRTADVMYEGLIHNWERWGTTRYIIVDDTINDSLEKAELLLSVSKRLPFELEFGGYMRLELFAKHPETIGMFRKAGLTGVTFGIETFNADAGKTVGKGYGEKAKDTLKSIKDAWSDEVSVTANFIIGLPNDTIDALEAQQQWIDNHPQYLDEVRYLPLAISKSSDSLLTQGKLADYYTENQDPDGAPHPKNMNWRSPIMTSAQASELCHEYRRRSLTTRPSIAGYISAFMSVAVARKLPLSEQRKIVGDAVTSTLRGVAMNRFQEYSTLLLDTPDCVSTVPSRPVRLPVPHKDVFKSKIQWIRK